MTKQKRRSPKRAGKPKNSPTVSSSKITNQTDRRDFLAQLRNGALVIAGAAAGIGAGIGAGGWYIVSEVRAGIREADLSKIGNGIPTIVQIHDPQCPTCQALQQETRAALKQFKEGELKYLVANIRQDKGRRFASQHGVPHVTLLLFDGNGERREILSGPNTSSNLEEAFRRHLGHQTRS